MTLIGLFVYSQYKMFGAWGVVLGSTKNKSYVWRRHESSVSWNTTSIECHLFVISISVWCTCIWDQYQCVVYVYLWSVSVCGVRVFVISISVWCTCISCCIGIDSGGYVYVWCRDLYIRYFDWGTDTPHTKPNSVGGMEYQCSLHF
jgi:hypothetical protein